MSERQAESGADECRHCGLTLTRHDGIGGTRWRDNSHHSPGVCFKARNLVHEPEDPAYCWADVGPNPRHQWDEDGVSNDSGLPLGYRCRWCARESVDGPNRPSRPGRGQA